MGFRHPGERGQATVELVALLPLALIVALVLAQSLAAGRARELAGHAAEAAAVALVEGGEPQAAARQAVSGAARGQLDVRIHGREVTVRLTPPTLMPFLAARLTASATADAGPTQ
jgi:hypothetical protein